ncbi:hypothetical protein GpartN1_g465.t1 [Galdieria partita]|uniref:Uncharacterized protein n=1 Tax=Galdieria partita TaxID=83374 RepID=A0A9C7PR42_9RHOD|nr:hypothetical protein GpartN1_g465.t1 [Galdieria partita]
MIAFLAGQPQWSRMCMKQQEHEHTSSWQQISRKQRLYSMPFQTSTRGQRQCYLRVHCQSSSSFDSQSISLVWLQRARNLAILLLVGSLFPSPVESMTSAGAFPYANLSSMDTYANHRSSLETTSWLRSFGLDNPTLQDRDQELVRAIDSECSTSNGSFNSNGNYLNKYTIVEKVITGEMSQLRNSREIFPWSAWFKVEDHESVNNNETVKSEKRGRYIFVIVTLLVIACVVPMIQYYSYTRDK